MQFEGAMSILRLIHGRDAGATSSNWTITAQQGCHPTTGYQSVAVGGSDYRLGLRSWAPG